MMVAENSWCVMMVNVSVLMAHCAQSTTGTWPCTQVSVFSLVHWTGASYSILLILQCGSFDQAPNNILLKDKTSLKQQCMNTCNCAPSKPPNFLRWVQPTGPSLKSLILCSRYLLIILWFSLACNDCALSILETRPQKVRFHALCWIQSIT